MSFITNRKISFLIYYVDRKMIDEVCMYILSAEEIILELKSICAQYPGFAKLTREGCSEDGRPVYSISVGMGSRTLVCTGGVHGRESVNPTVLVHLTKNYCEKYTTMDAAHLLQRYKIVFVPLLNPDGYEIALHDFDQVQNEELRSRCKSCGIKAKEWKYNARGVDINRNFPCQSYREQKEGDFPLSEAESRILANIFQRENSVGYIDFHSRGKEIFWYRAALDVKYNERQKKIAEKLSRSCGYRTGTPADEMQDSLSGGNTVQYYAERYQLPAITVETVEESAAFPLAPEWLDKTYNEMKEIPLQYLKLWDSM